MTFSILFELFTPLVDFLGATEFTIASLVCVVFIGGDETGSGAERGTFESGILCGKFELVIAADSEIGSQPFFCCLASHTLMRKLIIRLRDRPSFSTCRMCCICSRDNAFVAKIAFIALRLHRLIVFCTCVMCIFNELCCNTLQSFYSRACRGLQI